MELAAQLNYQQMERVVCACGVIYVMAMNGLVKILAGRQSARRELAGAAQPCLPLELIKTSVVDFVDLVSDHKEQLRSAFGDSFMNEVFR